MIEARRLAGKLTYFEMSIMFDVRIETIRAAVKGHSFKHLNLLARPQS